MGMLLAASSQSELRESLNRDLRSAMQDGLVDTGLAKQVLASLHATNATEESILPPAVDQELPLLFMSMSDLFNKWGLQYPVTNPVNDVNFLGAHCSDRGDFHQ